MMNGGYRPFQRPNPVKFASLKRVRRRQSWSIRQLYSVPYVEFPEE